jgi:Predicted nucleotide-binding protein containing TIR-like domain
MARGYLSNLRKIYPCAGESVEGVEFAVLIVTPDDLRTKRGEKGKIPRDNVIFELGLFMGRLGRERTYIVCDPKTVELPSDLGAITVAKYDSKNRDVQSALLPAATQILGVIREASKAIVPRQGRRNLLGIWNSEWINLKDPKRTTQPPEVVSITEQKGSKISGEIAYPHDREKRWQLEGRFSEERFLRLYYYPSSKAKNQLFGDYGCYFFEFQADGTLKGYSVGYCFEDNETAVSEHIMRKKQGKATAKQRVGAASSGKPLVDAVRSVRKAR